MGGSLDFDTTFLHDQLIKLGEMMGDGLHYEPDGKWITKEYNKIFNILYPEHKRGIRASKAARTNEQISKLLETFKCSCGSSLKQSRSGSIVSYCITCNKRYKAVTKKK
jgi:hypothetical protein